jgi:hypothetical protein
VLRSGHFMLVSRGCFLRNTIGNIAEVGHWWAFPAGAAPYACLPDQATSGQPCGPGGGARIHQTPSPSSPAQTSHHRICHRDSEMAAGAFPVLAGIPTPAVLLDSPAESAESWDWLL